MKVPLVLSFCLGAHFLLVAPSSAQTWNTQLVNPGNVLGPKSIIFDDSQNPIVLYSVTVSSSEKNVVVSRWTGTSWTTSILAHYNGSNPYSVSITDLMAVRADSLIHCIVKVQVNSTYYQYHYQIRLDGSVKASAYFPAFGSGALAIGPSNTLVFANANNNLLLRRFNLGLGTWSSDELVDGSSNLSGPCVTTGADGSVWIAYKDLVGLNLKLARSKTGGWDVWFVDTPGNVGDYPQILVDASNTAHITYYDATNSQLKYAKFSP